MELKTIDEFRQMTQQEIIMELAQVQFDAYYSRRRLSETQQMTLDLRLHQLMLELQNRELRKAQQELERLRNQIKQREAELTQ